MGVAMNGFSLKMKCIVLAALSTAGLDFCLATAKADEPQKYKPIDPETIAAYKQLGAEFGRFEVAVHGSIKFSPEEEGEAKSLPGFRFNAISEGVLSKLAPVQVPFGLDLSYTHIKDPDLKNLKDLKNVTFLSLGSKVTDAGLKDLMDCDNLTSLALSDTSVTDAGLKDLKGIKNLTYLSLGSKITDAGLRDLKDLKNLASLHLFASKVTDGGLKDLKEIKSLTSLDLLCTKATDAGLKDLKEFKNLTSLNLYGTKITEAGRQELREALPKCIIRP